MTIQRPKDLAPMFASIAAIILMVWMTGCLAARSSDETERITIPWQQAVDHVEAGEVLGVFQTHARLVYIDLKDGRIFETREPRLDAIIRLARQAPNADEISIATE